MTTQSGLTGFLKTAWAGAAVFTGVALAAGSVGADPRKVGLISEDATDNHYRFFVVDTSQQSTNIISERWTIDPVFAMESGVEANALRAQCAADLACDTPRNTSDMTAFCGASFNSRGATACIDVNAVPGNQVYSRAYRIQTNPDTNQLETVGSPDSNYITIEGSTSPPPPPPSNNLPTLTLYNLTLDADEDTPASDAIEASDPDGDALTYRLKSVGTGAGDAYYELDGERLAANVVHELDAAEFARAKIVGGADAGTERMYVKILDGTGQLPWEHFELTNTGVEVAPPSPPPPPSGENTAPEVNLYDITLGIDQAEPVTKAVKASDVDGDVLTYRVKSLGVGPDDAYYELDDQRLAGNTVHELTQAEFDRLNIIGAAYAGTEKLYVRVMDGIAPASWQNFTLTNTGEVGASPPSPPPQENTPPTIFLYDLALDADEAVPVTDAVDARDPDGDVLTYRVKSLGTGVNDAYYELDGERLEGNTAHTLTAEEFIRLKIVGAAYAGTENMYVRVMDNVNDAKWLKFRLTNTGLASNNVLGGAFKAGTLAVNTVGDAAPVSSTAATKISVLTNG